MSQRSSASHPASRSPPDSHNIVLPPVQLGNAKDQGGRRIQSWGTQQQLGSQQLPGGHLLTANSPLASSQAAPLHRGLGVHTILNPAEPEGLQKSTLNLGRGGGITRSPQLGISNLQQPPGQEPLSLVRRRHDGPQARSPSLPEGGRSTAVPQGRTILIPKSPRATSLGNRAMRNLVGAQNSPHISEMSHVYTAQPGSGGPSAIPHMPTAPQQNFSSYQAPSPALPRMNRASSATMGAPRRPPISQSASPSPSFSSYSGPSQPSPAQRFPPGQLPSAPTYFPGSSFNSSLQGGSPLQTAPPGTEGPYLNPLSESLFFGSSPSGGHSSNIRMMPISTEHGPVFMPVDVQAASKVADEKRARNAGASARFRQRRKEKEKEASTNIQKLEQTSRDLERKAREMEQERDFYRSERDRFRDIVYRTPSTRELAMQAPPSPRHTRTPTFPPPPAGPMYQISGLMDPQDAERPHTRRRTGTPSQYNYNSTTSSLPPAAGPYGPGHVQRPPSLPSMRIDALGGPEPASMADRSRAPVQTTRPPAFEQFPRGSFERRWQGTPGDIGGGPRK